jgi:hypothetical protein
MLASPVLDHERLADENLQTKMALAIHPSQPIHRDHLSGRRACNYRVAGSLVDREVKGP